MKILVLLILLSCNTKQASQAPAPASSFSASTTRLDTSSFKLTVTTTNLANLQTADIGLSLSQGSHSGWVEVNESTFETSLTSSIPSGELKYTLTIQGTSLERTALILPTIDSQWDQPEAVPGFVNTDGWEDSPEISPDGEFLIVSTYSPVSLFQCILDGTLATTPSCSRNSWATYQAWRPQMPYADRIVSPTAIVHSSALTDPADTTNASPPVSSYVFRKQSDGSFKAPAPLYMDWSGSIWGLPFGFTFRKKISGSTYEMYFSIGDPILGSGNQLQRATIDLSLSTNLLGRINRSFGTLQRSDWRATPLSISGLTHQAGNPASSLYYSGTSGFVFWDDESRASGSRELYFASEDGAGFGSKAQLGLGNAGTDKYQPYFFENNLYYSLLHGLIISKAVVSTTDLTNPSSFGSLLLHLGVEGSHSHTGRVTAIGEPSLYRDADNQVWMYFAYSIQKSSGIDLNIARVKKK